MRGKIVSTTVDSEDQHDYSYLKGYNFISLVAESDSSKAISFLSAIKDGASSSTCSLRLKLEHASTPEYNCLGELIDDHEMTITARKVMSAGVMAQLSDAKERIRVLFNKLPVALLVVSSESFIEAVNPTAEKMFGRSTELMERLRLSDFLNDEGTEEAALVAFFNEHPGRIKKCFGLRKDGDPFPVEVSGEYIDAVQKKLLLSIFDISERVALETLKKEFVEMISHDLRSPLTNLNLFLQSISFGFYKQWSPEKLESLADQGYNEVSRLIRMINQLLELDKLEHGFDKPDLVALELNDIIYDSISSLQSSAESRGIRIETMEDEADELTIVADRDQLTQVLVNLLGNAVKFSPDNGVVEVTVEELAEVVEVRVKDQGPGIPADMHELVFQRFAQLKTQQLKQGSGLGLAICKSLVEGHGGTIGVTSEPGAGSTFWFRLPNNAKKSMN